MSYKDRFILAQKKTKDLGLTIKGKPLPFKKQYTNQKKQQILYLCATTLRSIGLTTSSKLASLCIPVHVLLKDILKQELGIECVLTIGDRYWSDYIYCEMSYDSILGELANPKLDAPIKVHVWLTLPDGTILDCTGEAHADLLFKRGDYPVENCLMYITPDTSEDADSGYHRPYLLGEEFLNRTGAFHLNQ